MAPARQDSRVSKRAVHHRYRYAYSLLLASGNVLFKKKRILTRIWLISSVVQNLFLALEGRSVVVLVVILVVGATFIAILFIVIIVIIVIIFLIRICAFASSVQFVRCR